MDHRAILLVEDNPSDVALTRRALGKGCVSNPLVVASDGQQALERLLPDTQSSADLVELPAIVLLDLDLPKVDGLTILRRLRADARTRSIPVVILTSSDEREDLEAAYALGANSYIRKPVAFDRFVEVIDQLGMYWLILNEPPPAPLHREAPDADHLAG